MKRYVLILAAALIALQTRAAQLPEKLRVLTCDLASMAVKAADGPGAEFSVQLKQLLDQADPDVVFLQGATDWENSDRVAKLRPGLRVLTCSAFQAQTGTASQVAVLARDKAVLSWVEDISNGHGFAFAIIQAGPRKIGLFSVESADSAATARVLEEVKKLQQFPKNRPDAFLIAGASLAKNVLIEAGFENVAAEVSPRANVTVPEFWASSAGFLSRPRALTVLGLARPMIVTDIDTANSFPSKFAYQTPLLFPGETPAPIQAVIQQPQVAPQPKSNTITIVAIAVGGLLLTALLLRRRRSTGMELAPLNTPDGLVPGAQLNEAARWHLITWIKSLFVQRLLSERQHMIGNEAEATRRTLAIENKLADLQSALQDRISAYESRIERLEAELSAATFENRALIRSQIDLLKEKVAKAKEDFVYRRN